MTKQHEIVRGGTTFRFDAGKYSFINGNFKLENLSPVLMMNGKNVPFGTWKITKSSATGMTATADGKSGSWELKAAVDAAGKLTLTLNGKLKDVCEDLAVWYFDQATIPADHLAVQGAGMGGCSLIPLNGKGVKKSSFDAYTMMLITKKNTQLALSFPLVGDHQEVMCGAGEKGKVSDLKAGFRIKHITAKNFKLKPLSFRVGDGFRSLYAYGEENKETDRDFTPYTDPGWNSWDYYRWTVTEDEVLENAEFIAKDPVLSKHVKKIIIDDGWQYAYGEWDANSLFPHGMPWMAKQLKKLKFKPGLWIAPTMLDPHSRIAQMEPEMLGKAENGQGTLCMRIMGRNTFVLDPTVEKSQKFIYDLFDRYAGYGYEYFKLDFLGATGSARQFTDKKIGRGHLMDLTIGIARKATLGRAHILGCNYTFNGGQHNVDMARIGGDIHARWGSIVENTPSVALRFWANKKLWVNDPDFALCRGFDTSDDPQLTQMRCSLVFVAPDQTDPNFAPGNWALVNMNRPQAEVLLSIALCAGGSINLSDKMTRLNESGLDLARRTVSAPSGDAALPLDLFSSALPKYWLQRVTDSHRRLLMVNWEDAPAVLRIDLKAYGIEPKSIVNFWNDKTVRAKNGIIETELPPRSCLFTDIKA